MSNLYDLEEGEEPWQPRTARQVAERSIVLCCVAAAGEFPPGSFNNWLRNEGLWPAVSPREVAYLTANAPTDRQTIDATWRAESLQLLLWALNKLDGLPRLNQTANVPAMLDVMPEPDEPLGDFLGSASLRNQPKIDAVYEETYNAHSRLRSATYTGKPPSPEVDSGIVYERHYALNWLIGYGNQPWDQINTDT